jgi:hypothetical protein
MPINAAAEPYVMTLFGGATSTSLDTHLPLNARPGGARISHGLLPSALAAIATAVTLADLAAYIFVVASAAQALAIRGTAATFGAVAAAVALANLSPAVLVFASAP